MSGYALFGGGLELAAGLTELALQWLVQSTLVIAVGLAVAALLRKRTPALRSVVYQTTLLTALACPAAAYLLSTAGLTFIAIELPSARYERLEIVPAPPEPVEVVPQLVSPPSETVVQIAADGEPQSAPDDQILADPLLADQVGPNFSQPVQAPLSPLNAAAPQLVAEDPPAPLQPPAPAATMVRRIVGTRPFIAALFLGVPIVWGLITLALLARLALDHLRLAKLRRTAVPVEDFSERVCRDVALRLNVPPPRLLRTPLVTSPCLSGVFFPTVLLPEEVSEASLSAVMVHELAHRKRGDCFWNLLRHIGTALLWPQPLMWRLSHRMEAAAEDVCDDYVVEFGESRTAYAETLLTIAERNLLPASGAAVSLVTFRSMLGQRVQRILDHSRRLTLTVGLAALALVAVGGVSAGLVAGLLGPRSNSAVVSAPVNNDQAEKEEDGKTVPKSLAGTVLTSSNKPADGAHVLLVARRRQSFNTGSLDQSDEIEVLDQTRADSQGNFELSGERLDDAPYLWVQLLAKAPGQGLAWKNLEVGPDMPELNLSLAAISEARCRLLDSEGNPVADAPITISAIGRSENGNWSGVLLNAGSELPLEIWPENLVTNADGWLSLPDLPQETDFIFRVDKEPYARHWAVWKHDDAETHTHVLSPAQVITGTVVAADTGQPIPHARLTAFQDKRQSMSGMHGEADAHGRFRLNPYASEAYRVAAFAPNGSPYLAREIHFDWPATATEQELRIELPRGVLISGQITDRESHEPISSVSIQYEPSAGNQFSGDDLVTGWQATAGSDAAGRYSIAVPPGGGSLRVLAANQRYVVRQTTSRQLYNGRAGGERLYLHDFHKLDIPIGAKVHVLDIQLERGESLRADVVGPDGQPAAELQVAYPGCAAPYFSDFGDHPLHIEGNRLTIDSIPADGDLTVHLLDPVNKNGRVLTIRGRDVDQLKRVELEPCGSATLKMVDPQGRPLVGVSRSGLTIVFTPGISIFEDNDDQPVSDHTFLANFDRRNHWQTKSDEKGQITYSALIPGVEYQIFSNDADDKPILERSFRVKPGEHQKQHDLIVRSQELIDESDRNQKAMPAKEASAGERPTPPDDDLVTVRGTVLDPSGQPRGGVAVAAVRWYWGLDDPRTPLSTTTTDGAGQFSISYRKAQFGRNFGRPDQWREAAIVATAPGFGPGWTYYGDIPIGEPAELRLTEDHPIQGRIVDLEGQPVAGASIRVDSIYRNEKEDISRWIDAVRKGVPYFGSQDYDRPEDSVFATGLPLGESIVSDEEGRFEIRGIGRNRYVNLKLSGGDIAVASLRAVSMPVGDFVVDFGQGPFKNPVTYFGSRFEFVAEPSQPVEGVVRDAKTGQPLTGVRVVADKLAGGTLSGIYAATTTSDESGRYRLEGLPKGIGNGILAVPGDELPYFMREFRDVPTAPGLAPVKFDLDLHRGIWVTGSLREKGTGAPVRARMFYLPWPDNPHIKDLPEFNSNHLHGAQSRYETDLEGRFRLLGLPGRALVAAVCVDRPYPTGQGVREIADLPPREVFRKVVGGFAPTELHPTAVHEIRPADDAQQANVEFEIDPGKSLKLHITDDSGLPISGSSIVGLWPKANPHRADNSGSSAEMVALKPDERRLVLVHHADRQLGTAIELGLSDAKDGQVTVSLDLCATLKVRLVSEDREPLVGVLVRCRPGGEGDFGLELPTVATNENGVVNMPALLPGCKYDISAESPQIEQQSLAKGLEVAPGETIDLGEFDPTQEERPEPKRTPAAAAQADAAATPAVATPMPKSPTANAPLILRGVVLDPQGTPAAGVPVRAYAIETSELSRDSGDAWKQKSPPNLTTDAAGKFSIDLGKTKTDYAAWPAAFPLAVVVATAPSTGAAWTEINQSNVDQENSVHLVADQPITARIVNLEGQPIAGVTVEVESIESGAHGELTEWLTALRGGMSYRAAEKLRGERRHQLGFTSRWGLSGQRFVDIRGTTDAEGRVQLAGVGHGRLANLYISGPGIVTNRAKAVALPMEPIDVNMSGASAQLRFHGADFTLAVESSSPIEGIVRDADSGQPLPGVQVVSNQFAGTNHSQNYLVSTFSNAEGRYRLDGMPSGKGNEVLAIPADDQPYFLRDFDVPTSQPLEVVKLDLELRRGVWIEGQVRDAETKEPILGQLFYLPWPDHPKLKDFPELTRGGLPGPQDHYHTDSQGGFRLVGLPGRGLVEFYRQLNLASARSYPAGQGIDQIADLPSDEAFRRITMQFPPRSQFITAVKEVNAAEQGATDAILELREGDRIVLRLLDPAGQPLTGARVRGLSPPGQFYNYENLGPTVEVAGLSPGEKRRVFVEHPEKRLGKGFEVSVADNGKGPLDIRVEPYATITGKLNLDGDPLQDQVVRLSYLIGNNFVQQLESETDEAGQFILNEIPAGVEVTIVCELKAPKRGSRNIAKNLPVKCGETIDLGEIDLAKEDRPEPKRTPAKPADAPAANAEAANAPDAFQFSGQVLVPDGKPAAGAKLYLLLNSLSVTKPQLVGESADDGQFRFSLPRDRFFEGDGRDAWRMAKLVARADGLGISWALLASFDSTGELLRALPPSPNLSDRTKDIAEDQTLQLAADDVPIQGRIVDLEGTAVVGARVRMLDVSRSANDNLDAWFEAAQSKSESFEAHRHIPISTGYYLQSQLEGLFQDVKTNDDGRFEIRGIGRERVAWLQIEGPNIETRPLYARTRAGEAIAVPDPRQPKMEPRVYYGATFDFVVGPTRPIRGIVRDADSGAPLPGVTVQPYWLANGWLQPFPNATFYTVTDREGRYTLTGLPIGSNVILATGPGDEPYFASEQPAEVDPTAAQVAVDFKLKRGVWIRGRVIDAASQEPLRAAIEYHVFLDNPQLGQASGLSDAFVRRSLTNVEGYYRIAVLPGRGVVGVTADDFAAYPKAAGAEKVEGGEDHDGMILFKTAPSACSANDYHAVAGVNASQDRAGAEYNFALVPGKIVTGSVVDPDGKPLSSAVIYGTVASVAWQPLADTTFAIKGLEPGKPRYVQFYHAERNLAGSLLVNGDEQEPLTVKLASAGTLIGRLLDTEGNVPASIRIVSIREGEHRGTLPGKWAFDIDADGRFKIEGIPPGESYTIAAYVPQEGLRRLAEQIELSSAEVKDLGELTLPDRKKKPVATTVVDDKSTVAAAMPMRTAADFEFTGIVLDPNGKAKPGAQVALLYYNGKRSVLSPAATTAGDGGFLLRVASDLLATDDANSATLIVTAEGQAPSWDRAAPFEASGELLKSLESHHLYDDFLARSKDRTLRLVADDVPISGRVINLEGQGIAGARVRVRTIYTTPSGNLDAWLKAAHSGEFDIYQLWNQLPQSISGRVSGEAIGYLLPEVLADAQGRFQLAGVGRDRIIELLVSGEGLETRSIYVRTRPGETLEIPKSVSDPNVGSEICYGPRFDYALAPSRPVTGVVRDVDTDKPLEGIQIVPEVLAGNPLHGTIAYDHFKTTTDAEGRYRLLGLPIGTSKIAALPPRDEPYVIAALEVETDPAKESTTLDFQLKRGILIRGRVTDAQSGQPLRVAVEYFAFRSNPHLNDAPGLMGLMDVAAYHGWMKDDGRYEVVGLPGPGLISLLVNDRSGTDKYPRGAGAESIEGTEEGLRKMFRTSPYTHAAINTHYVAKIDPTPETEFIEHDIQLQAGKTIAGRVLDPEGQLLAGAQCSGLADLGYWSELKTADFEVRHLRDGAKRRLYFYHAERNLAGSMELSGDGKSPLAVKLVPAGTIKGRLLLENGDPAARVSLGQPQEGREPRGVLPSGQDRLTDADGRFQISGIIPGLYYTLSAARGSRSLGTAIESVTVAPGETKDLGDLTIQEFGSNAVPPKKAEPAKPPKPDAAKATDPSFEFTGKVLDPAGKPKPGAQVALLYYNGKQSVLSPAATTAGDGGFLLRVASDLLATDDANWATLVVTAEGQAFAWDRAAAFEASGSLLKLLESHYLYDQFVARSKDRTLRLVADDVPISGRIVNLEGQGVIGARIRVRTIYANPTSGLDAWLKDAESGEFNLDQLWKHVPESISGRISGEAIGHLLPEVVADAEGRFQLNGVGRDRLIELLVSGEGLETRSVYVRTRPGASLVIPKDATDADAGSETCYGATFDYALAPSRPVTGVVRDVDTDKPLEGIQIVPEVLAGIRLHSTIAYDHLKTTTDAEGRYRLIGLPIGTSKIVALPPRDEPYAVSALDVEIDPAKESTTLDFQLKRGIWIRGRATDAESSLPLRGGVEYLSFSSNPNRRAAPGVLAAMPPRGWLDKDGRYQVVGLPGPGLISLLANDGSGTDKYPRGAGAESIEGTDEGLRKMFLTSPYLLAAVNTNYVAKIDPAPETEFIEHDIQLQAGKTIAGHVLDPDGQPLAGAKCSGLANAGFWSDLKTDDFEVRHLQDGETRRLYFHHAARELAGSIEVRADEKSPLAVKLVPAGTIKGRLLLEDGDPASRVSLWQTHEGREPRGVLPGGQAHLTDADGRFQISGIIPGLYYSVRASRGSRSLGTAIENVIIAPGETKDLGDLTIAAPEN